MPSLYNKETILRRISILKSENWHKTGGFAFVHQPYVLQLIPPIIQNREKVIEELLPAISRGKQESVRIFSVGRNILKSLPQEESVKSIADANLITAFNQQNVQHLGTLSTDDELVFFYMKEDKIKLNGIEKIVSYIYDQEHSCIVVKIID